MGTKNTSTVLVSTGGGSRSLRTTIPMWIVDHYNLDAGDKVSWKFKVENGDMVVMLRPLRGEDTK